uniref:Glycoprotein n=1 Tax=Acrobeloides nanus TaxID=290746 RepID=A0A914EHL9_9BILA
MCNSTATFQTARVYTTKAYINEECNVSTVSYTTNMRLKGHLQYAPSEQANGSALMDITGPLQTGKAGIDWPDLLELITGKWINTLLFIGSITGTILLGVILMKIACCFPTTWLCRTRYPKPKNN